MAIVDYKLRPHQSKVLKQCSKKYTFLGAGLGSGKTDIGSHWALQRIKETPASCLGLIAANSYAQLIDSTLRNLYKNYQSMGIRLIPAELPRTHRPFSLYVKSGSQWVEILCRSLDSFKLLAGVELCWWWVDEAWLTSEEAIDLLMARLRDKKSPALRGLITTTLDDPTGWMYAFAEENRADNTDVVYATSYDNKPNLPPGYIEDLLKKYSDKLAQRMILAKWVSLESGLIYYAFDKDTHITEEAEFKPEYAISWTHDFNIGVDKPMSSLLCQIVRGRDAQGVVRPELHIFDEIIIESCDTQEACQELKGRGWLEQQPSVIVYGDASGRHKDTRSKTTDYAIISMAGFKNQVVPLANPSIRDRHNAVNSLLKNAVGDIRVKIHPRCKTLIKGLSLTKFKPGARYVEEEQPWQHCTTALGYLIAQEFPVTQYSPSGAKYWK